MYRTLVQHPTPCSVVRATDAGDIRILDIENRSRPRSNTPFHYAYSIGGASMRLNNHALASGVAGTIMLTVACSAAMQSGSEAARGGPDLITRADLESTNANNAFDAIERLRPQWLQRRGPSSVTQPEGDWPLVYMDNVRAGDISNLRTIPIDDIGEIRFINAADATTRWGTGVTGGVIAITSLKTPK
jgi:hypothetical protein